MSLVLLESIFFNIIELWISSNFSLPSYSALSPFLLITQSLVLKIVKYATKKIYVSRITAKKNEVATLTQSDTLRYELNFSMDIEVETQTNISKNVPCKNLSELSKYAFPL